MVFLARQRPESGKSNAGNLTDLPFRRAGGTKVFRKPCAS
jgi:hypothetical protein